MSNDNWIHSSDGFLQTRRHGPRVEVVAIDAALSRLTASAANLLIDALPGLEECLLSGSHFPTTALDSAAATALISAGGCMRLRVNASDVDAESLMPLLMSLGALRVLDLAGTALDEDAIRGVLNRQPGLAELRLGMALPQKADHRFLPVAKGGRILESVGALKGLERLSLRGLEIGDEVAEIPNLAGLTALDIGETSVGDPTAAVLGRISSLRELRADRTWISDEGLADLSKHGGIAILDLSNTPITAAGLAKLAGQRQLRQLSLRGIGVSEHQADLFASLTGLQSLDLSGTQVGTQVVEGLSQAPALASLDLPSVAAETIRACAGLHSLRRLTLSTRQPPWPHLAQLAAIEELYAPLDAAVQLPPNLRKLSTGRLDAAMVRCLPQAHRLESLYVYEGAPPLDGLLPNELPELRELLASSLTDQALRRVLAAPAIEALYVSGSGITQHGLEPLSEALFVHTLELRDVPLDRATAERIASLQRLHCLDVPGTGLGDAEIAILAGAPNLQSLALDPAQITVNSMAALADTPLIELYIYGMPLPVVNLAHVAALRGLLEIKVMSALIEVEHVRIIAALPSLRVVEGRFASQEAAELLAALRPDLRGFQRSMEAMPKGRR